MPTSLSVLNARLYRIVGGPEWAFALLAALVFGGSALLIISLGLAGYLYLAGRRIVLWRRARASFRALAREMEQSR